MINVTKSDIPPLDDYLKYLKQIWSSRWLTNDGKFVKSLEKKLKIFLKVNNILLVSNGTLPLQMALKSLQIKGEIITTPFTFATTTNVIIWEGLTPIFADIDYETYNIDPNDVERKITDKTVAILAVHVFGNPCDVKHLKEISEKYNLKLIYDAAHAFGVEYENQSVLNFGEFSTLSFHATKVFNTAEGGAIIINNNNKLLETMALYRNHGIKSEEEVILPGINAKMNEFQAILGLCNLLYFNEKVQLRKELYELYKKRLSSKNVKFQKINASKYNYSYMPVCFENGKIRNNIFLELIKNGIKARKYFYPLTVNFNYFKEQKINLVEKYKLLNAYEISNRILCLPIYPDLKKINVDRITNIINRNFLI